MLILLIRVLTFAVLLSSLSCEIQSSVQLEHLNRAEIAILQYDSRPLENYWLASASWNKHYCDLHGHQYLYYRGDECDYDSSTRLASPWCKVKAMRQVSVLAPSNTMIITYSCTSSIGDFLFVYLWAYNSSTLGVWEHRNLPFLTW